ncbi:hypothetical protein HK405_013010, partial [Cladochytrium tenue]
LMFGPSAPFAGAAMILQVATLWYSGSKLRRSVPKTDEGRFLVRRAIRMQWRLAVAAFMFLITWWGLLGAYVQLQGSSAVMSGSIGSAIEELSLYPWLETWYLCLYQQSPNGQSACSYIIEANLPSVPVNVFLLDLHLVGGVVSLAFFVLSDPVVLDVWGRILLPRRAAARTTAIVVTARDLAVLHDPSRPHDFLRSYSPDDNSDVLSRSSGGFSEEPVTLVDAVETKEP